MSYNRIIIVIWSYVIKSGRHFCISKVRNDVFLVYAKRETQSIAKSQSYVHAVVSFVFVFDIKNSWWEYVIYLLIFFMALSPSFLWLPQRQRLDPEEQGQTRDRCQIWTNLIGIKCRISTKSTVLNALRAKHRDLLPVIIKLQNCIHFITWRFPLYFIFEETQVGILKYPWVIRIRKGISHIHHCMSDI